MADPSNAYYEGATAIHAEKPFLEWTADDHKVSWALIHTAINGSKEHIVVALQRQGESRFEWQVITYSPSDYASFKQLAIFWNVLSNPVTQPPKKFLHDPGIVPEETSDTGSEQDPFCNQDQLKKQTVLEGKEVLVLLNYAPLISPKDTQQLDFLIVTKKHRAGFHDLRESEYIEAMHLAAKIYRHFKDEGLADYVAMYQKTGVRAGQTVKHWHLHVTCIKQMPMTLYEKAQTIMRGFWRTPLSSDSLSLRVTMLTEELSESNE